MPSLPFHPRMLMVEQLDELSAYLEAPPEADFHDPRIQALLDHSGWRTLAPVAQCAQVFLYVRDQVRHSLDARDEVVPWTASSVLQSGTGLCFAKSHLATALLRGLGVPTGYCYQRLLLANKPGDGYCLHGFNASLIGVKWVRFDARGNRPGVHTSFSIEEEQLAFRVRPELGEIDYPGVYAHASAIVIETLSASSDLSDLMQRGLPSSLT